MFLRLNSSSMVMVGLVMLLAVFGAGGCRQDMHDQPKYEPLEYSPFFADNRASRTPPVGTVARGQRADDSFEFTGRDANGFSPNFPMPVSAKLVERGRQRYDIYCSPCHDRAGTGLGMVVQRGYKQPPSFFDQRLVEATPGYFFSAITKGFGVMPSYAYQVPVHDRWAIAAYVKALQITRSARFDELSRPEQQVLEATGAK